MKNFFRSGTTWKWLLLGLVMIGLLVAARAFPILDWVKHFAEWARAFGVAGALVYGAVFGLVSILMVPCLPLTIAAGFTFGMINGVIAVMSGIAFGAAGGFLFSRYAARGAVANRIGRNARFHAIDEAISREGWKIVGLLRMCPVPFGLTNYLYGLTGVGFWAYMGATLLGMLPGTVAFVYFGAFGKQTLDGPRDPIQYALGGLTVVAMIAVTVILGRIARRAAGEAGANTAGLADGSAEHSVYGNRAAPAAGDHHRSGLRRFGSSQDAGLRAGPDHDHRPDELSPFPAPVVSGGDGSTLPG